MINIWPCKPNKKIGRIFKRGMEKVKPKYDIINIIKNLANVINQLKVVGRHYHLDFDNEIDEIDLDKSTDEEQEEPSIDENKDKGKLHNTF